jgi:hypothetical protein
MATVLNDVLPYDQVLEPDVRDQLAVAALRSALLLGFAGDLLLRGGGFGINALLIASLTAASVWSLDRQRGDGATRARLALLVPVVAAGVAMAWRDAILLSLGAILWFAIGLALHAAALRAGPSWSLWRLDAAAPFTAVLRLGTDALSQAGVLLARDVPAGSVQPGSRLRSVGAGWRGILAAVPILLVLNALLMSADPIWERQAEQLLDVDMWSIIGHLALASMVAWFAGGWLRGALLSTPARAVAPTGPRHIRAADVLVPLVLVNVLFAAFVALQLRTVIGGAEYVKAAAGLTFAEYARRGFFQLVFVAVLTLPALYAADAMTPLDHRARRSVHRAIAATLVLLVGILGSAAARMALYTAEYGLTEDRFYASAAMVWLLPLLGWFGMTVLRDRRDRFTGGALVSAWATWAALVVVNPDAIIVRSNVARVAEGRRFDARYASQLSLDAAPTQVALLERVGDRYHCEVRRSLAYAAARDVDDPATQTRDWRVWTLARWRADRAWARGQIRTADRIARCPGDVARPAVAGARESAATSASPATAAPIASATPAAQSVAPDASGSPEPLSER